MIRLSKAYIIGTVCASLAAIAFGLNPFFGIPLYAEGLKPLPVLFYRFLFAALLLAGYMLVFRKSFRLERRYWLLTSGAGVLMASTCLFWFFTFRIMDSGISATILSVYPVMVALIMFFFYKEKIRYPTIAGMLLALCGVAMLCKPGNGSNVCARGIVFIMLSALSYAVYIVAVKQSRLKELAPEKLTFYAMLVSIAVFLLSLRGGADLQPIPSWTALGNAVGLGLVPSLIAFLLTAVAIHRIGPTGTAVLGALDPVAAVIVGIFKFNENVTPVLIAGIIIIITAVTIVICTMGKPQRSDAAPDQ